MFAGLSVYLGWYLFRAGIFSEQKSEFKAIGIWIKLQKVGPGVFFALFGVAVLIHSISSPFDFKIQPYSGVTKNDSTNNRIENKTSKPKQNDFVFEGSYFKQDQEQYLKLAKSINTIKQIYITTPNPNMPRHDKELIKNSIENLEKQRDIWVISLYGIEALNLWNSESKSYLINPENVDIKSRRILKGLEPWMLEILE